MFGLTKGIGIDLGTATVQICSTNKSIVLNEPSVVAHDVNTNEIIAVGSDAYKMLGRTPTHIQTVRPLRDGVISDCEMTEVMLKLFLQKIRRKGLNRLFKFDVVVCVPSGVTQVEKRAVREAIENTTGVHRIELIEESVAAAIGAGIDIARPFGTMVVDIGGGTTDVAVISLGGTVVTESIKVAGDKFDEAIQRYIRKKYNLLIGERTAEQAKIQIGEAFPENPIEEAEITGRDIATGLPRTIPVSSAEMVEALEETVSSIAYAVKMVLEQTPPELAADICEGGIVMTGGGSMLHGLDQYIEQQTGVHTYVAEDPVMCVARGTGITVGELDKFYSSFTDKRK